MASFDECGIRFLSASSVENFSQNSAYWVARYMLGGRQRPAPAMIRAAAVKTGILSWLTGGEVNHALDRALQHYDLGLREVEYCVAEARKEQDAILPMLDEFFKLSERFGLRKFPVGHSVFNTVWLEGISVPFMTKPDFVFDDCVIDVHTTHRMPSEPTAKHMTNAALHMLHRGCDAKIIYLTMKKGALYEAPIESAGHYLEELWKNSKAIEAMVERVTTPEQALAEMVLQPTHYLWTPELLKAAKDKQPQPPMEILHGLQLAGTGEIRAATGRNPSGRVLQGDRPGDTG